MPVIIGEAGGGVSGFAKWNAFVAALVFALVEAGASPKSEQLVLAAAADARAEITGELDEHAEATAPPVVTLAPDTCSTCNGSGAVLDPVAAAGKESLSGGYKGCPECRGSGVAQAAATG